MGIIELKNISKKFFDESGEISVLDNVNLDITENSLNIIVGASGSGKTTLLNLIDEIDEPTTGSVIKKENVSIGYVTQHANFIDELSVEQNLVFSIFPKRKEINVRDFCKLFNCEHLLAKKPRNLSGGEKQRINIIRSLIMKPKVIILDEPTASLDHDNKFKVMEFIQSICNEKRTTFIIVTHDQDVVDYFQEKTIYKLKNKTLLKEV